LRLGRDPCADFGCADGRDVPICADCCCTPDESECSRGEYPCCSRTAGGMPDLVCKCGNALVAVEVKEVGELSRYVSNVVAKRRRVGDWLPCIRAFYLVVPPHARPSYRVEAALAREGIIISRVCGPC